jgi:hypothetical protein
MPMVPLGETVVILERLAEGHLTRRLFGAIVRRLGMLGGPAGWQPAIVAANEDEKGAEGDMSEKSVASATMPGVGVSDGPEQPFMGPPVTLGGKCDTSYGLNNSTKCHLSPREDSANAKHRRWR